MDAVIYALYDPRDRAIRYIGITRDPARRLAQHTKDKVSSPKVDWINELRAEGLSPQMRILERGEWSRLSKRESEWIKAGRAKGWKLTNATRAGYWNTWQHKMDKTLERMVYPNMDEAQAERLKALPERGRLDVLVAIAEALAPTYIENVRASVAESMTSEG